jgi:mRNA-degrading endonuclease RelE of RelBE toxin-antitoxin system
LAPYKILYRPSAQADIEGIHASDRAFIIKKIGIELVANPFPRGKTIKKIQGFELALYRLRVNASQSYRVFYQIQGKSIIIIRVVPKKEADKTLKVLKKYFQGAS